MLSRNIICMIMRDKDAFESFSSAFDELVVLVGVEKRINEETIISRFNVIAVDG